MYEVIEHWKQYKKEQEQAKELFNECGFQYKEEGYKQVDKWIEELMTKDISYKEFDKQLDKIVKS